MYSTHHPLSLNYPSWWEPLRRPLLTRGDRFDMGIHPAELLALSAAVDPSLALHAHPILDQVSRAGHHHHYNRPPWWNGDKDTGTSIIKPAKDSFQVVLDVQQFAPEEINVKVVDKHIVVTGEHDEKKDDHGYITRKFTRRYLIPDQCDLEKVESNLSSDGILTVTVARKHDPTDPGERTISIQKTGKPALHDKELESKVIAGKKDEIKKEEQKK